MFPESKLMPAMLRFEAVGGRPLSSDESAEVTAAGFDGVDPDVLAKDICKSLDNVSDLSSSYRSTGFWALGRRYDSKLRDFFRRHLAIEIGRDMKVAYQIMISLHNLKEPVWPRGQTSLSIADIERNRAAALRYLNERS